MNNPHQPEKPHTADVVQFPATPAPPMVETGGKKPTPKITQWIVLGAVAIAVFQSCQKPAQQQALAPRPMPPNQAQTSPQPQEGITREQIPQAVVRRNALIEEAIAQSQQVNESVTVARAEHFLLEAQQNLDTTNEPIESYLLRKLGEVIERNKAITSEAPNLSGEAEQVAIARAYNGDTYALLLALQQVQSGKTNLSLEAIAPAKSILTAQEFLELSRLLQQSSAENRLIQQSVDPNQQPPVVP